MTPLSLFNCQLRFRWVFLLWEACLLFLRYSTQPISSEFIVMAYLMSAFLYLSPLQSLVATLWKSLLVNCSYFAEFPCKIVCLASRALTTSKASSLEYQKPLQLFESKTTIRISSQHYLLKTMALFSKSFFFLQYDCLHFTGSVIGFILKAGI